MTGEILLLSILTTMAVTSPLSIPTTAAAT